MRKIAKDTVLRTLRSEAPKSAADIAAACSLHKSTARKVLAALYRSDMVDRHGDRIRGYRWLGRQQELPL